MTVLRIYPVGEDSFDWSRRDAADGEIGLGEAADADALPPADAVVLIVPAARMRTIALPVPPVAEAKLPAVVRFALEDQLAGEVDAQHIVIATRRPGTAIVHVVERRWLRAALATLDAAGMRPRRIVAESDLVAADQGASATWIWRDDGGFILRRDGSVAVPDQGDDVLPAAILLDLPAQPPPAHIDVLGPPALAERCRSWSASTGSEFVPRPGWSWRAAPAAAIDRAIDLATPDLIDAARAARNGPRRSPWRRGLGWACAALLLHAGASVADWSIARWRTAQAEREIRALIAAAAPDLAATPEAELAAAWRRTHSAARHRAGRAAQDDALPLLAAAAASLPGLPAGSLRTIGYQPGQLTLDFEEAAAPAVAGAAADWQRRGLQVLQAVTPAGLRVRITRP